MTWEEIIIKIRTQPEYIELVEKAYFEENLALNIERFKSSEEYFETKKIIANYFKENKTKNILDVGSGNGISAVSFAIDGNNVTAVEPDTSETIGSGAIIKLKTLYNLSNLSVIDSFGEKLPFKSETFDVIYIRQAMHHANNLNQFINETARVLKKGGLFLTIRDHVIYNEKDKQRFLESHPLHKFYGGENAFTFEEYKNAMELAGLKIQKVYKHFESIINYFPKTRDEINSILLNKQKIEVHFIKWLPRLLMNSKVVNKICLRYIEHKYGIIDECQVPGRMYSFIVTKPT